MKKKIIELYIEATKRASAALFHFFSKRFHLDSFTNRKGLIFSVAQVERCLQ